MNAIEEAFLSAAQVKARYGNASDMWLWRREHEKNSRFPNPIRVCGRRLYRLSDLLRWEQEQTTKGTSRSAEPMRAA
jgi:hypothetical protein